MSSVKPTCGVQTSPVEDVLATIFMVLGLLGTIASVITTVAGAVAKKIIVVIAGVGATAAPVLGLLWAASGC